MRNRSSTKFNQVIASKKGECLTGSVAVILLIRAALTQTSLTVFVEDGDVSGCEFPSLGDDGFRIGTDDGLSPTRL